jgi:ribosomal protein S18 acetylase RimI-like enzyme
MMSDALILRNATPADIPVLTKHRRWMFDDMLKVQKVAYSAADVDGMEPEYQQYLEKHLGGILRAWVVESAGRAVASGAMLLYDWPPRPGDSTGRAALLHSVYTDPEYRRRGLARRIVDAMIEECRRMGLRTVSLHASEAGQSLYEAIGFKRTSEMRLVLR